MVEKHVVKSAAIILSMSVMALLAWWIAAPAMADSASASPPAMAGFTPIPPTRPPVITPQPPEKEPKATPTISLTATPGLLPISGDQASEPGIGAVLVVGAVALALASLMVYRSARVSR